jgi:hypothetical protein
MRKFKIVTQTDSVEQGKAGTTADNWMDDCAPSSVAACVNWLLGTSLTSKDGNALAARAGRKDRDGRGDPTTHAQSTKAAQLAGLSVRYAKDWADVERALKDEGSALLVSVDQPRGYPAGVRMSSWHVKHQKRTKGRTYGHSTSAVGGAKGAQWADPTMSGKGAEAFAVDVTVSELRQIAASANPKAPHKGIRILRVAKPAKVVPPVTVPTVAPKPVAPPVAEHPRQPAPQRVTLKPAAITPKVDTGDALRVAAGVVGRLNAAKGHETMREQITAALLDALTAALSTSIAVFLGMGISVFDLTGEGAKALVASGVSAALMVLQRWLDEDNARYGRSR